MIEMITFPTFVNRSNDWYL